jgi:glycosyltransferase involved in cell wall biosynthesis
LKISVIIPAFNEERLIAETLRITQASMRVFVAHGWETELIVCDNNSSDRTAELAGVAGARVVFEPLNQIARARNSGAAAASGDWFIFLDADSHPSAELFADVAEAIRSGRCLAGGSTIKLQGDCLVASLITRLWNGISRVGTLLAGSFIFCEAEVFRKLGGFNQELFAAEELELSKRLKKTARKLGKPVVVLHRHPLLTSARKLHLCTTREHLRFLARTIMAGGKTLNRREDCPTWYDGRR